MRLIFIVLIITLTSCVEESDFLSQKSENEAVNNEVIIPGDRFPHDFKLSYSWSGLGSNMGNLAPVFIVNGTHFVYTMEQNSFFGEQTVESEKLCEGELSEKTIQSILDLVRPIEDSVVYETNIDVMSGGIHYFNIIFDTIDITFRLHNASHPIADKIASLLNTHIPKEHRKISLWMD